jgi:lipopolysaccharide transport system ATP-binding protein
MSSKNLAINVNNLGKCYEIYDSPLSRLKQFFSPRLHAFFGRHSKKYYREFWALHNVSFRVHKSETIGIIGRNGSGKSTLLQLICGTLTPSEGFLETSGRVAALLELGSGFNPEFSGRENVFLNASVLGLTKAEIDARFAKIEAFADIGDFIDRPVKTYSSGMMVRLAFAVIAHVDADILIIDEALAVGDAFFTQKCMRFLREFMTHGTVLFVSHDTASVLNLCQRAIWIEQGKVIAEGTPKEICERYLEAFYEEQQGASNLEGIKKNQELDGKSLNYVSEEYFDQRSKFINSTNLRNDIELFKFDSLAPSFGKGGVTVERVSFFEPNGTALSWIVGGEPVILSISFRSLEDLHSPIVGFYIKDRLGQNLFGDNTCLTYEGNPQSCKFGESMDASFYFHMPFLPAGDYSVTIAIAEGSQQDHVQHKWVHDALVFKSHGSSVSGGIIGIPMKKIELKRI